MDQKAEELYEDGWGTSQTTFLSRWTGIYGLKFTETGYVLGTIRRFQRHFPNQRTPCRQTIVDNYNKYVKYGLSVNRLNRDVGNSLETAFETWLFPEHYRFLYTLKQFCHIHLLKTVVWDVHQPSSYSSSAFCSIRLFQSLVSLIIKR